jgi:DNA-binding LacI/PurR family transcriptional regulator
MNDAKQNRYLTNPSRRSKYPTIGLLVHNLAFDLRLGVEDVTRREGANLICFPGGIVQDPLGFNAQANILYNLIDPNRFESLIIWTGALGGHLSPLEYQEFCGQFRPIPVVGVGKGPVGILFVDSTGYLSMCAEIAHLIEVHGYRRIAFIRGPQGHQGAKDRYQAYLDTLSNHSIPVNPELVTPPSDEWERQEWGMEAIYLLLDKRKRGG